MIASLNLRSTTTQVCWSFALMFLGSLAAVGAPAKPAGLSPAAALRWRSIGPYIGGRVVAVAGVPAERDLFYMGAVGGGVWRSTDYGLSWTNITDRKLPGASDSIGAIAVAPSDPKVIYVGTGESDIRNDLITGDGVFRSDDAGRHWQAAGLTDSHTISALAIDPHNPDVVYASSMGHVFRPNSVRGVFKSTDGGKTWKRILYVDEKTGAIDLVMDPQNPQVLYAAMWQAYRTPWKLDDGGPGSGLYKSVDGGAHWTEISRHPGFPQEMLGRIGVSVAASDPQVVYAIVQAKDGGIFRSDDGGAAWHRVNSNWSLRQRGYYYMSLYVDPTDPDTVYAPQVQALWVSRDGGKTFAKLLTPHGDNHIVWISPSDPKLLLEGNDGGATVSTDGGKTWSSEHNQPTGQFYHVALDGQFPFHVYGAQQDEGAFEGPSADAAGVIPLSSWHRVAYGESTFVAPQGPNVTVGSGYFNTLMRVDRATGEHQEISPWPEPGTGAASDELKYRFGWTHPILSSPGNPNELLVASQYVLETTDEGEHWTRISPDLTRNDPATEGPSGGPIDLDQTGAEIFPDISALAPSPLDARVIWAGSADGLVHVTTDGGQHWRSVTPKGLPEWTEISSIEPSPVAKGTAWLTASRFEWDDFHPYVLETTDYGQHWTMRTAGLPADQYAFVVRQDLDAPKLLFLGTQSTVYVSFDAGARWQPLGLNLPKAQVRDLAIDRRQDDVVAATHGRAFWILDDLTLLEQMTQHPAIDTGASQVFAPATAWLSHAYGASEEAMRMPDAGTNPAFGANVFFRIPSTYDGKVPVTLSFFDASGQLVRRFTLHRKTKAPRSPATVRDNRTPIQAKQAAEDRLTAIIPGMNRLRWNLHYPDAADVTESQASVAGGGPTVLPGRYTVVLDYDGHRSQQTFNVALDPRLHPAPDDLAARLALELSVRATLDELDRNLNQAIALREQLRASVAAGKLGEARAQPLLNALDRDVAGLIALEIQSNEGAVQHELKVHGQLGRFAAELDMSYSRPTPAMHAVFDQLSQRAQAGEQRLRADIARGQKIL